MSTDGGPSEGSSAVDAGRVRRVRWGPMCGLAALAYVAAVAADRMLLAADGAAYNDVHGALDGPWARGALALVLVAALFHALDGVRRMVVPDGDPGEPRARGVVAFAFGASGVPLVVVVLWPSLGPVVS